MLDLLVIIEGWAHNPDMTRACLDSAFHRGHQSALDIEVSRPYLMHCAQADTELDAKVGSLIRSNEHFLSTLHGFKHQPGNYGPEVVAALDHWLANSKYTEIHNHSAGLAIMSRSDFAKSKMLTALEQDDDWVFWPVFALLSGWGMRDKEVATALSRATERPAERIQYFAHHLPEIISDKVGCRAKLLEVARLDQVARPDFLNTGFHRLGIQADDEEVVETLLRHHRLGRGFFGGTDSLIAGFGEHPKIREIAFTQMNNVECPWSTLFQKYGNDHEIRGILSGHLRFLPSSLRAMVVSVIARRAAENPPLALQLSKYRNESGPGIRTIGSIAYHEFVAENPDARSQAVSQLKEDIVAIGPWMHEVRPAAFLGFVALDELPSLRQKIAEMDAQATNGITLDLFLHHFDTRWYSYLAKHWNRVVTALGDDVWTSISRHSGDEAWFWEMMAPHIGESLKMRNDFIAYCSRERNQLSGNGIEALARELPHSFLLREHCVRVMEGGHHHKNLNHVEYLRRELIVGRILGKQFDGNDQIRAKLEEISGTRLQIAVAGLSIGWKDSHVLAETYACVRDKNYRPGAIHWPDAAAVCSQFDSDEQFVDFIFRFVENGADSIWHFLSYCVDPIVERIQSNPKIVASLMSCLKGDCSGNAKARIPRLLAIANFMTEDLCAWCEEEYRRQSIRETLPEFGMDLFTGKMRPVAHTLLDVLVSNQQS